MGTNTPHPPEPYRLPANPDDPFDAIDAVKLCLEGLYATTVMPDLIDERLSHNLSVLLYRQVQCLGEALAELGNRINKCACGAMARPSGE